MTAAAKPEPVDEFDSALARVRARASAPAGPSIDDFDRALVKVRSANAPSPSLTQEDASLASVRPSGGPIQGAPERSEFPDPTPDQLRGATLAAQGIGLRMTPPKPFAAPDITQVGAPPNPDARQLTGVARTASNLFQGAAGTLERPQEAVGILALGVPGVAEVLTAPAAFTGGRKIGQVIAENTDPATSQAWLKNGGHAVSDMDAANAAAQLATMGLMRPLAAGVKTAMQAAKIPEAIGSTAAGALGHAIPGAIAGAAFSPDNRLSGALAGAALGAIHGGAGGMGASTDPSAPRPLSDLNDEANLAAPQAPARTVGQTEPIASEPDFDVSDDFDHALARLRGQQPPTPAGPGPAPEQSPAESATSEPAQPSEPVAAAQVARPAEAPGATPGMHPIETQIASKAATEFTGPNGTAMVLAHHPDGGATVTTFTPQGVQAHQDFDTQNQGVAHIFQANPETTIVDPAESRVAEWAKAPDFKTTVAPTEAPSVHAPEGATEHIGPLGEAHEDEDIAKPGDLPRPRTTAGTLKANLTKVPIEHLENELHALIHANSQEDTNPTLVQNESRPGDRPYFGMKKGAAHAQGRVVARQKSIDKVEAEIKRRGVDPAQSFQNGMRRSINNDPTGFAAFEKPKKFDATQDDMFGSGAPRSQQEGLFAGNEGTEAARSTDQATTAARSELVKARAQMALERDPAKRAAVAGRVAELEKVVNRGKGISADEMATRAVAEGPPRPEEPGQHALFEKGAKFGAAESAPHERAQHYNPDQLDAFRQQSATTAGAAKQLAARQTLSFGSPEKAKAVATEADNLKSKLLAGYTQRIRLAGLPTAADRDAVTAWASAQRPGEVDLRGLPVPKTLDQLHKLVAFTRSPFVEHLSTIVPGVDGKVHSHSLDTSGALNYVDFGGAAGLESWLDDLAARAKAPGANGTAIVVHNHPSGIARVSNEDLVLTQQIADGLAKRGVKLAGHLVIDHDTYSWMQSHPEGVIDTEGKVHPDEMHGAPDWTADVASYAGNSRRAAQYAIDTSSPEALTVHVMDTQGRIIAVEPRLPSSTKQMQDWLPDLLKRTGGHSVFLATSKPEATRLMQGVRRAQLIDSSPLHSIVEILGVPTPNAHGRTGGPEAVTSHAAALPSS